MSQLKLNSISHSFGTKRIFSEISFSLENGDRLALIGENGTGKTTLLRMIAEQLELDPENGSIEKPKSLLIGYLPQQLDNDYLTNVPMENATLKLLERQMRSLESDMANYPVELGTTPDLTELQHSYAATVTEFESLGGYEFEHLMQEILPELGLSQLDLDRPLASFSGGERMRLALAHLILSQPDLLLLDEPTNHLDYRGIAWLSNYLTKFKGCAIIISHDRAFLNETATRIGKLAYGELKLYQGNYTQFVAAEAADALTHNRQVIALTKAMKHEQEVTATMLSHRKISQYHNRKQRAQKLEDSLAILKQQTAKSTKNLKFTLMPAKDHYAQRQLLISGKDVEVSYEDGQALFAPFTLQLYAGEHVAICGANGCGKTTLLNAILGRIPNTFGELSLAANALCGELGQITHFEDESLSALDTLAAAAPTLNETALRSKLATYGFLREEVFTPVSNLSGGERARLNLAILLLENPDLLLLDEPTNHLDIHSCEILEEALRQYKGAILLVSHDRYFVEQIATKVFGFVGKKIVPFASYAEWLSATQNALVSPKQDQPVAATLPPTSSKIKAKQRQMVAAKAEQLRQLEQKIITLEKEKLDFENGFATGDFKTNTPERYVAYANLLEEIESLTLELINLDES